MTDSSPEPTPDVRDVADTAPASPADGDPVEPAAAPEPFREAPGSMEPDGEAVDLDAIERDLAAVERALERLSDGTYWTDEVTGEPIPEHLLADDPTVRRA